MAREALESRGFQFVKIEFSMEDMLEFRDIMTALIANLNLDPLLRKIESEYEEVLSIYTILNMLIKMSRPLRYIYDWIMCLAGNSRVVNCS